MAAPTLVAFAEAEASQGTGVNLTTASITWQTSDVVVVIVGNDGGVNPSQTINTPTTTGSGLTFTNQRLHQAAFADCGGGLWTAVAASGSSGTVSVNQTFASGSSRMIIGVYVFRGSSGVGNSAISTGSSRVASLTLLGGADGSVAWGVFDWSAVATVAFSPAATTHTSGSPGPTASPVSAVSTGTAYTYYIGDLDDQVSTGAVNYGIGGSGTGPFTIVAVEAKTSGAAAPVLPYVTMAPNSGY